MNQKKINEVSAAMAKLFSKTKKPKAKPVKKALKALKKPKRNKSVTPPKGRAKTFAQLRKEIKLLNTK